MAGKSAVRTESGIPGTRDAAVAELTTGEAADLLQVSRTYLVQLLDAGRIPCRTVGAHRRVRAADIVAYRRVTETRRRSTLDELTARDQELGLQ